MLKQTNCKNTFVVVGADKGGVGKTTLSRVLIDYIKTAGATLRMFDSEPAPGVLKRFFPDAVTANLSDSLDQERIIDKLTEARVTLVDVRAGELSPTLHLFQRIGFAHGEQAHLIVFHLLGNNITSLTEVSTTSALLANGGGDHVLVKNYVNDGKFFEGDEATWDRFIKPINPAAMIEVTTLDAGAAERVDASNQPFDSFIKDAASNSFVMRGLARNWHQKVFSELDRIGFKNLIA